MARAERVKKGAAQAARRCDGALLTTVVSEFISRPREDQLSNPLTGLIGYHIRRASNALVADLAARLAPLELSPTKGSVLLLIRENPGIAQIQISRVLSIKRANMVPLITGLDKQGLISRTPVDGRSQGLELSEKGRDIAARVERCIVDSEAHFRERLSRGGAELLLAELSRLWEDEDAAGPVQDGGD